MPVLNESDALSMIDGAGRVLLLEPDYRRKYPPLGLMKIAARVHANGGKVKFARHYLGEKCDLICVTTLFTYESPTAVRAIKQALELHNGTPILVGGVYASLMTKDLVKRVGDVPFVFPAYSKELDVRCPDYSINWNLEEPWDEFSFTFTTRGCPNSCAYCAVPKIEPVRWVNPEWRELISVKPNAMISDNNLSAAPPEHVEAVLGFLADRNIKVVFDNGFDNKFVTKEMAAMLGRLKFTRTGMRLAFDRIEEDGSFQKAVETLKANGVPASAVMVYVLFNFADTPREADYRMSECIRLGVHPYPQKFQKLNQTYRGKSYLGKHWTRNLSREFRYFWLMAGLHTKTTFDEHLSRVPPAKSTADDRAAWEKDRKKWETRRWKP